MLIRAAMIWASGEHCINSRSIISSGVRYPPSLATGTQYGSDFGVCPKSVRLRCFSSRWLDAASPLG